MCSHDSLHRTPTSVKSIALEEVWTLHRSHPQPSSEQVMKRPTSLDSRTTREATLAAVGSQPLLGQAYQRRRRGLAARRAVPPSNRTLTPPKTTSRYQARAPGKRSAGRHFTRLLRRSSLRSTTTQPMENHKVLRGFFGWCLARAA